MDRGFILNLSHIRRISNSQNEGNDKNMKEKIRISELLIYSFLGWILFLLVGIILQAFSWIMTPYGYVFRFLLFVFCVYKIIFHLGEMSSLSLNDCRICFPKVSRYGLILSIFLPIIFQSIEICGQSGHWEINKMSLYVCKEKILYLLFYTGLCSGITEEMMFRGYLTKLSEQYCGKIKGILLPTILFTIGHFVSHNQTIEDVAQIILYAVLSILLTSVTYISNSIWDAAIIHSSWDIFVSRNDIISVGSEMDNKAFFSFVLENEAGHPLINLNNAELLLLSAFILLGITGILWFVHLKCGSMLHSYKTG